MSGTAVKVTPRLVDTHVCRSWLPITYTLCCISTTHIMAVPTFDSEDHAVPVAESSMLVQLAASVDTKFCHPYNVQHS